jgi:UDP-glucose 4-epimerase
MRVCEALSSAHLLGLEHVRAGFNSSRLNLGSGSAYSVKTVLACVGEVVGKDVPHGVMERRAGDYAVLVPRNLF